MTAPFLYFGYGSNLDEARLHLHCPSARLVTTARLGGYRLAFSIESKNTWHGGVGDIRQQPGSEVWGALWVIDDEHAEPLDRQEGVFRDPPAYRRITIDLETAAGDRVTCRTYQVVAPEPEGFLPSPAYRDTILRGARAIGLPAEYLRTLEAIRDNGHVGGGPH
ncbi:MAG: gamma-glutamylcyclotransferase [Chloroflexi bacterium]|nr:gamma-glutamylcyclotransferase [Chloroflexota bacterium]MDA1146150.1 gamma-glutamylcyclotransferase [Chloroflexota bacterium]